MPVDWTEVIKLIGGPLAGGAIALSGIWIKELFDRRRATQNWFEEKYIAEGLDRFYAYIMTIQYSLMVGEEHPELEAQSKSLPVEAINRLQIVLKTEVFTMAGPLLLLAVQGYKFMRGELSGLIAEVDAASKNPPEGGGHIDSHYWRPVHEELRAQQAILKANNDTYVSVSSDLRYSLEQIRVEMLKTKIRKKSDIYKLAKSRRIQSLLKDTRESLARIDESNTRIQEATASLKRLTLHLPEVVPASLNPVESSNQN